MKQIKDLLNKEGKVQFSKLLKEDGSFDMESLQALESEKPVLPSVSREKSRELSVKKNRDRYTGFPEELPVYDMMPLPPDEHELIGLFESKQNLYLLIAHAYNKLSKKCKELEKRLSDVESGLTNL